LSSTFVIPTEARQPPSVIPTKAQSPSTAVIPTEAQSRRRGIHSPALVARERRAFRLVLAICLIVLAGTGAAAEGQGGTPAPQLAAASPAAPAAARVGASSPDSLAAHVLRRFESGTPDSFDSIYIDVAGRAVVRDATGRNRARRAGLWRVVERAKRRAVVLLSGTLAMDNSGDATNAARRFTGFYEAAQTAGQWTLGRLIPFDEGNRIRAQAAEIKLVPGKTIDVVDTMDISVGGDHGWAARLNHATKLASLILDGKPAEYALGGGVLWIKAPRKAKARLVLRYSLDAAKDANSAETDSIGPMYGGVQNDFCWLPFFDYNGTGDHGSIRLTVHAPAAYQITTTLPQTESVEGNVRTVHGQSQEDTFVNSILYDREWQRTTGDVGEMRFETFLTPNFNVPRDTIVAVLRRTHDLLTERFGEPQTKYIGFMEQRSLPSGFRYRANTVVAAGKGGGRVGSSGPTPGANLSHEIAHGWTNPAGSGANFLREGWATFAESIVLREQYGADVERAFWEVRRNGYLAGSEGRLSILGNPDNGAVHYSEGSWVLRMLRDEVGDSAFNRGMRAFMKTASNAPSGHDVFIAAISKAAGRNVGPWIAPWLSEKVAPDLAATVENGRVIVTQTGPVFILGLNVDLTTAGGIVRRSIRVSHRVDALDVRALGEVSAVRLDPDGRLLLKRHEAEMVRFSVKADSAKTVALSGDFMARPIPAVKSGGVWSVEVPMVEGRYYWAWQIDGAVREEGYGGDVTSGVRVVRPVQKVENPYPRF
jgi:hypothetical protein